MSENVKQPSDVPLKDATEVPVDWLRLDRKNPRLAGSGEVASDAAIISELYRGEELGELLQSPIRKFMSHSTLLRACVSSF